MNYIDNKKVDVIRADQAIIDQAKIIKRKKDPNFKTMALVFLLGALSFAVALSFNNFAQAIIKEYSFGSGIKATFINLLIFTFGALTLLYIAWKINPDLVSNTIN